MGIATNVYVFGQVEPSTLHVNTLFLHGQLPFQFLVKCFSKMLLFFSWPLDILNSRYISLGLFYEKLDLTYQFLTLPHTHLPASPYVFLFVVSVEEKLLFVLHCLLFLLWAQSHTHLPLQRFDSFYWFISKVAQNKSVSWSLTTSTWLFHWHIKKQCHNATLFCFDCGLNRSSQKK